MIDPTCSEAEVWAILDERLAGAQCMPEYAHGQGLGCDGLCDMITTAQWIGLINDGTAYQMTCRIRRALTLSEVCLAPPRLWRPRVAWCRRFAREAAKEMTP